MPGCFRFYDTGFNLSSSRQFCSRFVREVLAEATGTVYGDEQRFADLFAQSCRRISALAALVLGNIPWQRITVTPESMRRDPALYAVFDGLVL